VDKLLAKEPLRVPMLIVAASLIRRIFTAAPLFTRHWRARILQARWSISSWAVEPRRHGAKARHRRNSLRRGYGNWFRRNVMQPFLDHYLKDAPKPNTPRVLAYETGADQWQRYDAWPRSCAEGCPEHARNLYLLPGSRLGFEPPQRQERIR